MKTKEKKINGINIEQLSDAELAALVFEKLGDRELFPEKVEMAKRDLENMTMSDDVKKFFQQK